MHVLATAGHVDHGKSTLVRALTGTDPDRWEEEHRRGLTIDLGYAWTSLASGEELAFVDVPGHSRFIGNMLAGLGPAPGVVLVVAADEGWREQTEEHLAAVDALALTRGLLVVTRSDLADPGAVLAGARARVARSSLGEVEAVAVSARSGAGLEQVRGALGRLVGSMRAAHDAGRVRLWVDRAFTVTGSGTVLTGTLGAGSVAVGDELEVSGRVARVRGVQSLGRERDRVAGVARVAVNLRGVDVADVGRGDALLTPGAWPRTDTVDVRVRPALGGRTGAPDGGTVADLPGHLTVHAGTAAVTARVRPLGDDLVRLTLPHTLPLEVGDRFVLRDPGRRLVLGGAVVLDPDPPPLARRGAARARAEDLAGAHARVDVPGEVARRGPVRREDLLALGASARDVDGIVDGDDGGLTGVVRVAGWLVPEPTWRAWGRALRTALERRATAEPLDPTLPTAAARDAVGLPDGDLVAGLAAEAGLELRGGRLGLPGVAASLGAAEAPLARIEERLRESPFAAPERPELEAAGLGRREVAAAVSSGRLVRLGRSGDEVLLLPDAPARAMRVLAGLPQPFTTSQARQALGTSRRVVIPLLEHLDSRRWTRRIDAGHREVVRP